MFNFCKAAENQCMVGENQKSQAFAIYRKENDCKPLTDSPNSFNFNFTILNTSDTGGVKIHFMGPVKYEGNFGMEAKNFSITFDLKCNKTMKDFEFKKVTFNDKIGNFLVDGEGKASCPILGASTFYAMLGQYKYLYAIIAIVIGVVECFFGFRLFKPTLFLVKIYLIIQMGFILGFISSALFLVSIWTGNNTPQSRGYIILGFSFFVGITIGFLVYSLARIGLMVTGSVLGLFLGLILYNLLLHKIISQPAEVSDF